MFLLLTLLAVASPAADAVRAELVIPPAETHVIGDVIPLQFRFENQTTNPLAFMWEGCCRFNGRLTVTRNGESIPPVPPGQALAHMFAKAERLDPGKPRDFDTRLSDWVTLADSGTYELRGRYRGVLPFQQPQVQRGLELWRDTAETPPLQLSVLSLPGYLAQRDDRAAKRGIQLELSGPSALPPLQPVAFKLKLTNTGARAQTLRWPDAFQLWLVRPDNTRVPTVANVDGNYDEFTLAPGAIIEREIPFISDALEGEPLGSYRVFVDLAASGDQPRVPSNPLPLAWKLSRAQIVALLNDAASGGRTGARNAPLKLLRVYLGELSADLAAAVENVSANAQPLARDLAFAAALKPLQPVPGLAELELRVGSGNTTSQPRLHWRNASLQNAMPGNAGAPDALTTLSRVIAVRRHLGWDVAVALLPDDDATLGAIAAAAREVNALRNDLAHAPRINLSADTNRICFAEFPVEPAPAGLRLRLSADGATNALRWEMLRAGSAAGFEPVANLEELLDGLAEPRPVFLVGAAPSMPWAMLRDAVKPFVARAIPFELAATPATKP